MTGKVTWKRNEKKKECAVLSRSLLGINLPIGAKERA